MRGASRTAVGALVALAIVAAAAAPAALAATADAAKININTAAVDELVTLPGIGKAYAQRIVDYREKNGPFKKVEELINVRGIGEKTFEKIRDRLTVGAKG